MDFQREIRPILSDNCFQCHGPDSAARQAGLRLDRRESALEVRPNGAPIVPGKSAESLLYQRISDPDVNLRMPPPDSHKRLTAAQIAVFKRWIDGGAPWKEHWAFQSPVKPKPPAVKDAAWVRNPIDRFILAKLEEKGLAPAPVENRRALVRRVALDTTGLPPKPAEVETFLQDASPGAYERMVDRYLASPHYGEHRARYWLDAARYGDTHGIHVDNYREIWPYRDWVIAAFNRNLPFDQFTIEQLAGDLLPNPTLDQRIATGFQRCNVTTNEVGIIDEEYAEIYAKDRADTVGAVWLGMTVGCATCHDHKFDPISQKDFYALGAFFRNTTQKVMDGNISDTPPVLLVPRAADRAAWEQKTARLSAIRAEMEQARETAAGFLRAVAPRAPARTQAATAGKRRRRLRGRPRPAARVRQGRGPHARKESQGGCREAVLHQHPFPVSAEGPELHHRRPAEPARSQSRVGGRHHGAADRLPPDRRQRHCHRSPRRRRRSAQARHLECPRGHVRWLAQPVRHHALPQRPRCGSRRGWAPATRASTAASISKTQSSWDARSRAAPSPISASSTASSPKPKRACSAGPPPPQHSPNPPRISAPRAADWYLLRSYEPYRKLAAEQHRLNLDLREIARRGSTTLVMEERADQKPFAHTLYRGAYDQKRDRVEAATPAVLPPMASSLPRNRLGFARWLFTEDHPLTARVAVNRMWQEIFGVGLVKTADDFGSQGEPPSHAQLLDWLAVDFRESGWDVKRFYRQVLNSATYRQMALATADKLAKDPENRLLSRGPRFRMDAEMLRDYALAASGLLAPQTGGPSVKPYQPEGIWEAVAMDGSNTRFYKPDSGAGLYRRSLYTFWKRSAPPASMDVFNAPTRESCVVRRERTNTPLQALAAMNDVQFVEAARVLAEAAMENTNGFDARLDYISARVLARPLAADERQIARRSYNDFERYYSAHPDDARKFLDDGERKPDPSLAPGEHAALTMLASQLLNLDEVLNK